MSLLGFTCPAAWSRFICKYRHGPGLTLSTLPATFLTGGCKYPTLRRAAMAESFHCNTRTECLYTGLGVDGLLIVTHGQVPRGLMRIPPVMLVGSSPNTVCTMLILCMNRSRLYGLLVTSLR